MPAPLGSWQWTICDRVVSLTLIHEAASGLKSSLELDPCQVTASKPAGEWESYPFFSLSLHLVARTFFLSLFLVVVVVAVTPPTSYKLYVASQPAKNFQCHSHSYRATLRSGREMSVLISGDSLITGQTPSSLLPV